MLGALRKFSTSIYAKILLGIVVIPFVFWGMGSSFTGGSKNIVVKIDKEKYSTQEFADFIRRFASVNKKINVNEIDEFLTIFIGEKLIAKEVKYFKIKLSDKSLSQLIKHQKDFKRENIFSRTEYEKFLLENNITATTFETNLAKNEKKKQLLSLIGGGILPSKFLVNASYDKINQKRDIQLINLSNFFNQEFKFTEDQIKSYYEINKDNYKEIFKSINILELSPKNLTSDNKFNSFFFKKIDEIDDMTALGENLNFIIQKFNLGKPKTFTLNESGKDLALNEISEIPKNIIENIFAVYDYNSTSLIENKDKYFIVEIIKTENVQRGLEYVTTKKMIISKLRKEIKEKLMSEIISKINQNNFVKSDFDEFSSVKSLSIEKIRLENQEDDKILKKEFLNAIYTTPEKKVIVVYNVDLTENYLIYIDRIENVSISEKANEYKKYLNISQKGISNEIFNTYDEYIKRKYKIDINYKALEMVKNYFN